jgi:hypothetical protein
MHSGLLVSVYIEFVKLLSANAQLRQVNFQLCTRLPALPAFQVHVPAGEFIFHHAPSRKNPGTIQEIMHAG